MHYHRSLLITGGAGFIGSHVVRLLANKYPQYHIVCLDKLTYAGNLKTLEDVAGLPNYTFVEATPQARLGAQSSVRGRSGEDREVVPRAPRLDRPRQPARELSLPAPPLIKHNVGYPLLLRVAHAVFRVKEKHYHRTAHSPLMATAHSDIAR